MKYKLLLAMFVWLVAQSTVLRATDEYQPGKSYFGHKQYIEYLAGDLPFILSAPHGGRERPDELPDREAGTFAFDTNTQELAREIAAELHRRTGHWPHVIICRVNRRKLDCNREIVEAAAGHPLAEQTWHEFQGYIDTAHAAVLKTHGRGFYIDLHGHGHANQRLELGYLHSVEQLALSDEQLNVAPYSLESSLQAIAALGKRPYSEILRGESSFGALLEKHGYPCSPSPSNPHPEAPYFRGGYNTARHGRDAAPLAGMQIESYSRGVRDTPESRVKFAKALTDVLETYLPMHLGVALVPPVTTQPQPAPVPATLQTIPAPLVVPARGFFHRRR